MKKLLLGAAFMASSFAIAQTVGVKAGMNTSTISSDDSDPKFGFYGGAYVNVPVAKNFSIQPEVLFNNTGAKYHDDNDLKVSLSYISVPVMFQYNALPNLYFEAGPQFSFLVDSKFKYKNVSLKANDYIKGFDFGIGLGAGYYLTKNIGVNLRYVAGLTDVLKNQGTQEKGTNQVVQFGLTYKFK